MWTYGSKVALIQPIQTGRLYGQLLKSPLPKNEFEKKTLSLSFNVGNTLGDGKLKEQIEMDIKKLLDKRLGATTILGPVSPSLSPYIRKKGPLLHTNHWSSLSLSGPFQNMIKLYYGELFFSFSIMNFDPLSSFLYSALQYNT